ncbi:MAG: hypothetical protein IJ634_04655 [Bacteroidales bacterium]|nr:hypothetical protein [Bacteroidales bacterium]
MSFLFLLSSHAHGQAVARLSADTILLGDQTTLSIQRAHTYPSTDQLSQNGIVALCQEFDTAKHTQLTTLTSFEPGVHYVKLSPDDSLQLTVLDVDVDTTSAEIRDIAPIEKVPYTFWEIFRWILLGLAIIALALAGWWFWKKWKSGKVSDWFSNIPVDTRTPEERALDRLEELRQRQMWQAGKVKDYHTELTDTVRIFIEEATGIHATEMTSDETVEAMANGDWKAESAEWKTLSDRLRIIFTTADLVKFAKSEPLPHEHDRSMSEAVQFVKELWLLVKPAEPSTETKAPETKEVKDA